MAEFEREWLETIALVEEEARRRGEIGGLITGYPKFDQYTEGLQPGLILVGGQPNTGKTAFLCEIAWRVATRNNAYVLYFSLDDSLFDTVCRVVALDQRIPINAVRMPARYPDPELQRRRRMGMRRLAAYVRNFKVLDQAHASTISQIDAVIKRHLTELALAGDGRRLAVVIDNFHDVQVDTQMDNNARYELVASELDRMAQTYSCPVICSAEFRKLNALRRPTLDDLRETVKTAYKAKLVLLVYNEVGLRGEAANIYWESQDTPGARLPVLEVHFAKNKLASFKDRLFYHFRPRFSSLEEASPEQTRRYEAILRAS